MAERFQQLGRIVAIAATGLLGVNLLPHTYPAIPRKLLGLQGTEAPQALEEHVRRIAEAMNIDNPDRVHVFISKGLSAVSAGWPRLPRGGVVGLPRTVLFAEEEDVKSSGLTCHGEPIEWNSELGVSLVDALIPSADQLNFLIAHELAHLKNMDFLPHALLSPAILVASYGAAKTLPTMLFPKYARAAATAIYALGLFSFMHFQSALGRWQEFRADKMAASTHSSYREGGIVHMKRRARVESLLDPGHYASPFANLAPLKGSHPPFAERMERLQQFGSGDKWSGH